MEIFDFLSPSTCNYTYSNSSKNFVSQIDVLTQDTDFSKYDLFLVGIQENNHAEESAVSDILRTQFSFFSVTSKPIRILDLGNVLQGKTFQDSVFAIKTIVSKLYGYSKPIIVLGATHDFLIPFSVEFFVNDEFPVVSVLDSKIDFQSTLENHQSHFISLVDNFPQIRVNHFAHQLFYTNKDAEEWFQQKYFPTYRLAEINDLLQIEPLLRDSHVINFNLSSIRYSDNPGVLHSLPSGLFSEQASQIAWYSGFSDKMRLFFLTGYSSKFDVRNVSAFLSAQIIWHVIDGVSQRKKDILNDIDERFSVFYVKNDYLNQDMVFYQSKVSKSLWVEVPTGTNKKRIVPCSVADYRNALKNEIPNDWLLEFNRIYKKNG